MEIDKDLQHKILKIAKDAYPGYAYPSNENGLLQLDRKYLAANLKYLEQEGFLEVGSVIMGADNYPSLGNIEITNLGLNELSIIDKESPKIEIEAQKIKDLLIQHLNSVQNLDPSKKNSYFEKIENSTHYHLEQLMLALLDTSRVDSLKVLQLIEN